MTKTLGRIWSEARKATARATRQRNRARDFVGARFRVQDRARAFVVFKGAEIEIVESIRSGYLWLARDASGATFPVHSDWLRQFCDLIESGTAENVARLNMKL